MHIRSLEIGSLKGGLHLSISSDLASGTVRYQGCINGEIIVTCPSREAAACSLLRRVLTLDAAL